MEATTALRPGSVRGPYPQRDEPPLTALERFSARTMGWLRQKLPTGFLRFERIVERVGAHEIELRSISDAAIPELTLGIRHRLTREGLNDACVAQAFALIREVSRRRLGMRHFDVQLLGGWVLLTGRVAEMQTGEGKTLVATLPAGTAALAGIPVHVVTVNDYLVNRDAELMRPLYEGLGLTVGTVTEGMDHQAKQAAYACDVTYCTNKQLVFDYLRDRLVFGLESNPMRFRLEGLHDDDPRARRLMLRGLCYAIIDEADSVLVDEARTPLIISQPGDAADQARLYRQALRIAGQLVSGQEYKLRRRERELELTDRGKDRLEMMAGNLGPMWSGAKRREALIRQALTAQHLFERDLHYLVRDGKVQIIDEYTGRTMPDRSWEQGLHQLIEAKEGCEITAQAETIARISYQKFFRRYLRLSGMTGTAREITGELWAAYRLNVVAVPTHRPMQRRILPCRVYPTADAKWTYIVSRVQSLRQEGRPILIGTRSVAASEQVSLYLQRAGVDHQVLNARQNAEEAEIIARAGQRARLTVATNMAGRGTDIVLGQGMDELGGLHVIATELHDAGRIDRQLFGRCARQGDRGSAEFIVSLDDELNVQFYPASVRGLLSATSRVNRPLVVWLGKLLVNIPQKVAERRHARVRREMLQLDEHLGNLLAFSGRPE